MNSTPAFALISMLLLTGCASRIPEGPQAPPEWAHATDRGAPLAGCWWKGFGDPALDGLVWRAWNHNPDIEIALQRVMSTRADRFEALAAFFPTAGLQLGWREGREQTRDTGFQPADLKPWTAQGGISWELDLTGKRRAMLRAAKAREAEAWAAWKGSRLLIATEVCAARIEQSLYTEEIARQRRQLPLEAEALGLSKQLLERGLIDNRSHSQQVGLLEMRRRTITELLRLRANAGLRLQRLVGGGEIPEPHSGLIQLPVPPTRVPAAVWRQRPDLIAAEASVRKAFAVKDGTHLNLLPTLSLNAGATLASSSPRDGYEVWTTSVGPQLSIPIWDPARIANLKRSRTAAAEACARFRSTSDKAVEEIESASNNLLRHRAQLTSHDRETRAHRQAWLDAEARFHAGLASAIERTDLGRAYANSAAATTRMRLKALNAHLRLIRALGG